MEIAVVVLLLMLVVSLGAAGWLLWERSRRSGAAGAAAAGAEAAAGRVAALEEERGKWEALAGQRLERVHELERARAEVEAREAQLLERKAELEGWIERQKEELKNQFESLAGRALGQSREDFLALAKERFEAQKTEAGADLETRRKAVDELVKPIGEALEETRKRLEVLSREGGERFARLDEQISVMGAEARKLSTALAKPQVRGAYGEMQLRRVAELAGMVSYCDFDDQRSVTSDEGRTLRPDMTVTLPSGRVVVVDAKCNIQPYVDAASAGSPEEQEALLTRFADGVAAEAKRLAGRAYWESVAGSVDFVVMFVPGDQFIDAALARRPGLLDAAAEDRVILASPSTLIGLLRAVHVGWREARLAEEAERLFELGKKLHGRAVNVYEYIAKLGDGIKSVNERYNKLVGSVDARLTPTLKEFEEAGARSTGERRELGTVEVSPRGLMSAEGEAVGGE